MKPLHHALREARVRAGLTQEQAAELSGIHRAQLCDLERTSGSKKPIRTGATLRTLLTLAGTYGQTVSELIGEVPPPERRMNERERRAVDLLLGIMRDKA